MNIQTITNKLNEKLKKSKLLYDFQEYRRDIKDITRGSNSFFNKKQSKNYAFHFGGREEVQFNIGMDKDSFRYGLGFSFQSDINVKDPLKTVTPKVIRFNEYISRNIPKHKDLLMWRWYGSKRSEELKISSIPDHWIEKECFIFIGNYINKDISELTNTDIDTIVSSFEKLYDIYEHIELCQNKISKICWNSNEWIKPSGIDGKSKYETFEKNEKFGHEEWLFDFSKLIDGYHYAGLEPIGRRIDKHSNELFNIRLFTYNSNNKKKYWVADLKNVRALTTKESDKIYQHYKKVGWLESMYNDLEDIGADPQKLNTTSHFTFNIKFKPEDVTSFTEELKEITNKDGIKTDHYVLLNDYTQHDDLKGEIEYKIVQKETNDNKLDDSVLSITRKQSEHPIEFKSFHNSIQNGFTKYLKKKYPKDEITKEALITGINRRIDIFQQTQNNLSIIYEIKSYNCIKTSLRVALGQMLEYAYFPNRKEPIKLVLVTHRAISDDIKKYVNNLNSLHKLDLGVIYFDNELKKIIDSKNFDL